MAMDNVRALVQRPRLYDFLPQPPRGFLNIGHHKAKFRYLKKLATEYALERITACPICNGSKFLLLATQERHGLPIQVHLCLGCGLAFNSPRLSKDSLGDHYRRDYREIERGTPKNLHIQMFKLQADKAPFVLEALEKAGVILNDTHQVADVGCGEGGLLSMIYPNAKKVGFELNVSAADFGQKRGINIVNSEMPEKAAPFDLIVYEQVLEHVSDLNAELSKIATAQRIGGYLYVGVPGILNFPIHYNHNFIDFLEYGHFWHFNLALLERLFANYGYRLIYGDEIIRSVFEKVSDVPITPELPPVAPADIVNLIEREEHLFSPSRHFLRHMAGYAAYAAMAVLSKLA